jgi:HMG box factor
MATLWRGIVGPDITIYIRIPTGGTQEDREGVEEVAKFGGVECRRDCGAVVVRVPFAPSKDGMGGTNLVEEKTLRRLGFEVLEMVRGGMAAGGGGKTGFERR